MAKVKCTRCGAEVEAQKFCIQCGERLIPKESSVRIQKTSHTPSGVMRFRHKTAVSQSALPTVSSRQNRSALNLASLQSTQSAPVTETPKKAETADSVRQSRELEALLLKLNGSESEDEQQAIKCSETDEMSEQFQSLEVNMSDEMSLSSEYGENVSFDNSFFFENKDESNVSGPIPVGSGSFARVPSGGFHLVVDSIKSACKNTVTRIRNVFSKEQTDNSVSGDKKRRNQFIAAAVIAAIVTLVIVMAVSGNDNDTQTNAIEVASQTAVGGNENFAIVPIEEEEQDITTIQFDADDLTIPDLEFAFDDEIDPESDVFPEKPVDNSQAIELAKAEAKRAAEAAAGIKTAAATTATTKTAEKTTEKTATTETVVASNKPVEARMYGRNDNVLASDTTGESYKTKRSCVMREGPASRFGMVKEVASGSSIKILANTEEDWVLQDGGVWTKGGISKLGPGSKFADATKGMSVPQPKSRVISSNNWRYIQVGNVFGYVGPACFK